MSEDGPVESDKENSQRIKDGSVNNEYDERHGQPAPGRRGVQSGAQHHVSDAEHRHQYQYQGQHEDAQ